MKSTKMTNKPRKIWLTEEIIQQNFIKIEASQTISLQYVRLYFWATSTIQLHPSKRGIYAEIFITIRYTTSLKVANPRLGMQYIMYVTVCIVHKG